MKISAKYYQHRDNGFSLELLPETEQERQLLSAMWLHGRLEISYGPAFLVRAFDVPSQAADAAGGE